MSEIEITEVEKQIIEFIINVNKSLLKNFYKLRDLELTDKTNSLEFKEIIDNIKSSLVVEEDLYAKIPNNHLKNQAILDLFTTPEDAADFIASFKKIINNNESDLIIRRLINTLVNKNIKIYQENTNDLDFQNINNIIMNVKKDYLKTILVILNTYLTNSQYQNIKKELLTIKYNLAFLFEPILNDFLNNNFLIDAELYWTSQLNVDNNKIDKDIIEFYEIEYARDFISSFIKPLEDSKVVIYNQNSYLEVIKSQILLRSAFLFTPLEIYKKIEEDIKKIIYMNNLVNNTVTGEYLSETLEMHKQDLGLPRILTLGL